MGPLSAQVEGVLFFRENSLFRISNLSKQSCLYLCPCMGRIMGIDFGMKRTGISVTDPNQIIVQGLDTKETEGVLDFIISYGSREPLDEIVVGYPFVEGAWGDKRFKEKLDKFIEALKKAFATIPITLHDERNTSVMAKEIISR